MKTIGEIIATKRKSLNMTQKELADKLNVTNKTVSKWENGTTMPDLEMIDLIALNLNASVDEFFPKSFENKSDLPIKSEIQLADNESNTPKPHQKKTIFISIITIFISLCVIITSVLIITLNKSKNNPTSDPNSLNTTSTNSATSTTSYNISVDPTVSLYQSIKIMYISVYYKEGTVEADYSQDAINKMALYRLEALADIYTSTSVGQIDTVVTAFVAKMDNVLTISEELSL